MALLGAVVLAGDWSTEAALAPAGKSVSTTSLVDTVGDNDML